MVDKGKERDLLSRLLVVGWRAEPPLSGCFPALWLLLVEGEKKEIADRVCCGDRVQCQKLCRDGTSLSEALRYLLWQH